MDTYNSDTPFQCKKGLIVGKRLFVTSAEVEETGGSEYRVKREATLWTSTGLMLRLTPHFTSSINVIVDSGSPSFFLVNYVNSSLDEHQLIRLVASAITLKQNSPSPNERWTGERFLSNFSQISAFL
ncbi:hypothetical protein Zmor_028228 [Zophobas morio]|uniref:Uncharacterized protein n=1 Tax=Zophobas morio TaxID=2755281 RepID=A0AA38HQF9_9CUCU|nr:hypothetical protein Zmor_028228 [Zophobas morio]